MNIVNTELLRTSREEIGYSHRDMAKLLGARSSATYYNIENNRTEPKASQLIKISEILKIPIEKILL